MIKSIKLVLIVLVALGTAACSISVKMNGASIPDNINTFSVQYIENRAPLINPTLSQNLTEGLKDRISNESRLKIKDGTGDVHFSGEITGYSVRPMAIQADAVSAETRLTMTIKVRYKNYKDPKANWESSFSAYRDFDSNQNITEIEDALTEELIEELTENIFNKAFADW